MTRKLHVLVAGVVALVARVVALAGIVVIGFSVLGPPVVAGFVIASPVAAVVAAETAVGHEHRQPSDEWYLGRSLRRGECDGA
jgi:hypothetical protein